MGVRYNMLLTPAADLTDGTLKRFVPSFCLYVNTDFSCVDCSGLLTEKEL